MLLRFFTAIIGAFIVHVSFAQVGELRGVIKSETDGIGLSAAVRLVETNQSLLSSNDGIFSFGKIKSGTYTLLIAQFSYDTLIQEVTVKPDRINTFTFYLKERSNLLRQIEVNASKNKTMRQIEPRISTYSIKPLDLKRVPAIGGEPDIVQYLQILPGVVSSGDQGGQLYIRGGSPVMNKVLMDGMTIYNPFHSIGLFSVFDADVIRNADVYAGGFNTQYGGRISAVIDVQTRDGSTTKTKGKIGIGPFLGKVLLEGPLKKYKPGEGSISYLLSYRNSYLNRTSPVFYPYAAKSNGGLPFGFSDFYGKISMINPNGTRASFFGFSHNDFVRYPNTTQFGWKSSGGGVNVLFVPEGASAIINAVISYSSYLMQQFETDLKPRQSGINGFNAAINFTQYSGKNELKYGMEINGFRTDFSTYNSAGRKIEQYDNTTELCSFVKYRSVTPRWVLEPGFRVQYYASLGNSSLEPRMQAKYNVTQDFRFKGAAGFYSQNLLSATSDRDVVNLFYGFLSGPDNLPKTFNGSAVTHRLQKSRQAVFGFEWDMDKHSDFMAETYIKQFTQLTNINREKIYEDDERYLDKPDLLKKDFIVETGRAWGVDMKYVYESVHWYLWAVYSLTYVTRFDGTQTYFPVFDRRHNVNLLAQYLFSGKNKNVKFQSSARWNIGSGFPFTQTQGYYQYLNFGQGVSTDYTTANGSLGISYAALNGGRLPWYHRLDLSIERKQTLSWNRELNISFTCSNVYNRANIFYFDRVRFKRVNQLPILPAITIGYSF